MILSVEQQLLKSCNAKSIVSSELIQTLWSGYGSIVRYQLETDNQTTQSVIVKSIQPPQPEEANNHPRGWHSHRSHQRKLFSYQVEAHWYQYWASNCNSHCRVAQCYGVFEGNNHQSFILLEDLDVAGFNQRHESLSPEQATICLKWLAHFHATFLHKKSETIETKLWPIGSYWYLDTRPDEFKAMADSPLKTHALAIDQRLTNSPYQTIIHGDAKVANFCFDPVKKTVAAVDFQYVGGGCGMKDVAYFLGSCLNEEDCEQHYEQLLDQYFVAFSVALSTQQSKIDVHKVEQSWRELFPFAWADFHRFILGWAPQHWKNNDFSQKMTDQAIAEF